MANRLVLVAITVTVVFVGADYFGGDQGAGEGFRAAWALGALYVVLALLSDVAPEVGGPLALLVMLGVVFARDQTIYRMFGLELPGKETTP